VARANLDLYSLDRGILSRAQNNQIIQRQQGLVTSSGIPKSQTFFVRPSFSVFAAGGNQSTSASAPQTFTSNFTNQATSQPTIFTTTTTTTTTTTGGTQDLTSGFDSAFTSTLESTTTTTTRASGGGGVNDFNVYGDSREEPNRLISRQTRLAWLLPSNFELLPNRIECQVSRLQNAGLFPYRSLESVQLEGLRFEEVNGGLTVVTKYSFGFRELLAASESEADLSLGANATAFDPVTGTHTGSEGVISRTRLIAPEEVNSLSFEFLGQIGTVDRLVGGKFVTWRYFWNPGFFPEGSSVFRTQFTIQRLTFWEDGAPEPSPDPWDDPVVAFGWPQYTSGPILVVTSLGRSPSYMAPRTEVRLRFYENEEDAQLNTNIAASVELILTVPFTGTGSITNNALRALCSLAPATGLGVSRSAELEGQLFSKQHIKLTLEGNTVRAYLGGQQIGDAFTLEGQFLEVGKSYYARVFIRPGLETLYIGNNRLLRSDSPVYGVRLQTNTSVTTSPTYTVPTELTTLR
jgi:hypothetical protein